MNNNRITVFSLKIANELVSAGFELKGTGINVKKPQYKVFFFDNSREVMEMVDKLSAELRANKAN